MTPAADSLAGRVLAVVLLAAAVGSVLWVTMRRDRRGAHRRGGDR